MKKIKVGIIGCGTIGSALARILCRDFKSKAVLSFLCDRHPDHVSKLSHLLKKKIPAVTLRQIISKSDLIIESASASVAAEVAKQTLKANKQALIMSVGGLIMNRAWRSELRSTTGKLWIPSGAVAGIDGLSAAAEHGVRKVKLVTSKPPAGLDQAPYFRKKRFPKLSGHQKVCVFKGSAAAAVKGFPQNVNVSAILSLAGLGAQKTEVEIWTSRSFKRNTHQVTIEGLQGKITVQTENLPSPANPKTSALAYFSAAATLRKIFSPLKLGT